MESVKTPNWRTKQAMGIRTGTGEVTLEAGSFVKPVELRYVPKHVQDSHRWFMPHSEIWCYTKYGFYPIDRTQLEST